MNVQGKKIFVGLSGGVDSAVSAALLKKAGAQVTGVFIKGWYPPGMPCTWAEDRRDAMRVAAHLEIPFRTLDASDTYKHSVIEYLLREYRVGRTPNPDIMCNRDVKFGAFYEYARASGADAIATGHYLSGEKDQRYFLWAVPKDVFQNSVFPVGHMDKKEVRTLASRLKLPVADKRDSQGICFLGPVSVEEFLRHEFSVSPGEAFDEAGNPIGTHEGVLLHTIGERIPLLHTKDQGPWFIQAKDLSQNRLIVSKTRNAAGVSGTQKIRFSNSNWHEGPTGVTNAQYRYRGPNIQGHIEGDFFVVDSMLEENVAPGQSLVFFHNDQMVGGGIIE